MIGRTAPEPVAELAFGPFDADARVGHRVVDRRVDPLDHLRRRIVRHGREGALSPLEAIGLHDLGKRLGLARPRQDVCPLRRQPPPLGFDVLRRRRLQASRNEPMQPLAQQEGGQGRALFGKAEMEVLDAVEMPAAPLGVDLPGALEDPALLRVGELASRDARDASRIEALDVGGAEIAAKDALVGRPSAVLRHEPSDLTTFAKHVRREVSMAALGATERQRIEALQRRLRVRRCGRLDEGAVQAMIARDAEGQMAVPDVMKVRGGRHRSLSFVSLDENKMRTSTARSQSIALVRGLRRTRLYLVV